MKTVLATLTTVGEPLFESEVGAGVDVVCGVDAALELDCAEP